MRYGKTKNYGRPKARPWPGLSYPKCTVMPNSIFESGTKGKKRIHNQAMAHVVVEFIIKVLLI